MPACVMVTVLLKTLEDSRLGDDTVDLGADRAASLFLIHYGSEFRVATIMNENLLRTITNENSESLP
jgi:hypothetical protein